MGDTNTPKEKSEGEIRLEAMLIEAIRQRDLCYSTGDDLIRVVGELAVLKSKMPPAEFPSQQEQPAKT